MGLICFLGRGVSYWNNSLRSQQGHFITKNSFPLIFEIKKHAPHDYLKLSKIFTPLSVLNVNKMELILAKLSSSRDRVLLQLTKTKFSSNNRH